jgi:hypothetical protein
MAELDIAEQRVPQDGRFRLRVPGKTIDFRVSIMPSVHGEDAVIRILDKESLQLDLTRLGFDSWSLEQFQKSIHNPYGMVLITGPTGSGKTTTRYSAIHTVNSPDVNIMTAEDPVEYNLKGVNQVQVFEDIGRTFAAALRSFLRQDPDVILVGETRDLETAQISIRAALTGHMVFTTLHTNDSVQAVDRILDSFPAHQSNQVRSQLSMCLLAILSQRLIPRADGQGLVAACHDISDGGLLVALAEMAMAGDDGAGIVPHEDGLAVAVTIEDLPVHAGIALLPRHGADVHVLTRRGLAHRASGQRFWPSGSIMSTTCLNTSIGTAPSNRMPLMKKVGVPATPSCRPCSTSASTRGRNRPPSKH